MSSYLTDHKGSLNLLLSAHFSSCLSTICYSDWLLLLEPRGYLRKYPGVPFKMAPLNSEFTIGALVRCSFETDRFINASTHTPTHTYTHTPSGPKLPRSPAHQVELPAHSPALQLLPRRRFWDTNRQLWPILGSRRPSDSPAKLGCDGGLSPQVDRVQTGKALTCVSTLHHHRCVLTPPSPGTADYSWTYRFDMHLFYKVLGFFFSIWGSVELKAEIIFTLITQLDLLQDN